MADDRMELARNIVNAALTWGAAETPEQEGETADALSLATGTYRQKFGGEFLSAPATPSEGLVAHALEAAIVEYCGCSTSTIGSCAAVNRECCIVGIDGAINSQGERIAKTITAYLHALSTPATSRPEQEPGYYEPLYPAASPLPVVPGEVRLIVEQALGCWGNGHPPDWVLIEKAKRIMRSASLGKEGANNGR